MMPEIQGKKSRHFTMLPESSFSYGIGRDST